MVNLYPLFTPLVALGALAIANPIVKVRSNGITVPIATHIDAIGASSFVKQEQARAQALFQRGKAKAAFKAGLSEDDGSSIPITNTAVSYTIQVGVGNPATNYELLIDTGSSNTWVGANKKYIKTETSTDTGASVSVNYGSGSFSGEEFTDMVNLGGGLIIPSQSIGVANTSQGLGDLDGILGIGPTDLTSSTLSSGEEVPTVLDNLAQAGIIPSNSIGIFFTTPTSDNDENGELTFGGVDSSKISGDVQFVPITSTSPANQFWGIDQTITYGTNGATVLSNTAGIVDTGTTLILIATDAFERYTKLVNGTLDQNTGLLTIKDLRKLESLFFTIGGTQFELTAEAQTWPKDLNSAIGGDNNETYLIIGDNGTPSGQGLDFINGLTFLEHFYSVYDTDNQRVGIANIS
ncbi:aspartic peptidase A1 [Ramaria rubella]|nr:aspartic peptidase A1 [Ramaria rubella]